MLRHVASHEVLWPTGLGSLAVNKSTLQVNTPEKTSERT